MSPYEPRSRDAVCRRASQLARGKSKGLLTHAASMQGDDLRPDIREEHQCKH